MGLPVEPSDVSVIVPSRLRSEALGRLLRCLALQSHRRFEVIVALDGGGAPAAHPDTLTVRYLHLPQVGISEAKNRALAQAHGDIVLLLNDDVEPQADFVAEHLRAHKRGSTVVLGASPFVSADSPSRLDWLIARTRMIFFYEGLQAGQRVDFRHAWNLNLSVNRAHFGASRVRFAEGLRPCMYEDLELAHRLLGDEPVIVYHPAARAPHRHRYTLEAYFVREAMLGVMAPSLWRENAACFRAVFGANLGQLVVRARAALEVDRRDQQRALAWLAALAGQSCPSVASRSQTGLLRGESGDPWLNTWYMAHLPLKRRAFRLGLLAAVARCEQAWPTRPSLARTALEGDSVLSGLFSVPERRSAGAPRRLASVSEP